MRGSYHVVVQNRRVKFEFDVRRSITIVRGDSATGKTTLMSLVEAHERLGDDSGVTVSCERRCITANNANWQAVLDTTSSCIVFVDEDTNAIKTPEFARKVRRTDNYYVIITRENLPNLPYSVEEVYGIHTSGRYADLRKTYNSFYRLYEPSEPQTDVVVGKVIVEDSNSGYDFFRAIADEDTLVVSAGGKSNVRRLLSEVGSQKTLVIADGAAFGPEMSDVHLFATSHPNVYVYLPESFEWIVLSSGLIDGNRIRDVLQRTEDYVESSEFFSWEQFFTKLLVSETKGTYLRYSKSKLNEAYLGRREAGALLDAMGNVTSLFATSDKDDA